MEYMLGNKFPNFQEEQSPDLFQKVMACMQFFRKKAKNVKKGKTFENLRKNVLNLKIF